MPISFIEGPPGIRVEAKRKLVREVFAATREVVATAHVDALDETAVEQHADAVAQQAGGIDVSFNAKSEPPTPASTRSPAAGARAACCPRRRARRRTGPCAVSRPPTSPGSSRTRTSRWRASPTPRRARTRGTSCGSRRSSPSSPPSSSSRRGSERSCSSATSWAGPPPRPPGRSTHRSRRPTARFSARATLEKRFPAGRPPALPAPDDRQRALLERYVRVWESVDLDGFVVLLKNDAVLSMPPWRGWYRGRAAIRAFFAWAWPAAGGGPFRLVPTAANRQPAFALYRSGEAGYEAHGIWLLTLQDDAIASLTGFFAPRLFAAVRAGVVLVVAVAHLGDSPLESRPALPCALGEVAGRHWQAGSAVARQAHPLG